MDASKVIVLTICVALLGAAWVHGFQSGQDMARASYAVAEADLRQEIQRVRRQMLQAETERLAVQRERDALREELDAQGDADPSAASVSLPVDSVRRINGIGDN